MKVAWFVALTIGIILIVATQTPAFEAILVKESRGGPGPADALAQCPLEPNMDGTCANLGYYNLCSGYIWIFLGGPVHDGYGTRFDGLCTLASHRVKRAITYFRNTFPNYNQTVDVYLDSDFNNDGCPDEVITSELNMDTVERWNCSSFDVCVSAAPGQSMIVRVVRGYGVAPSWVTDGPYTATCDPVGLARSFYYPVTGGCHPWIINSPTGRNDNFLTWLIIDTDAACGTATENASWGSIKGLYQ